MGTQIYPHGQVSKQENQSRCPRRMNHVSPSIRQSDLVPNKQTQVYHRGLPEKDGKENPGRLHQTESPTPNSKNGPC